LGLALDEPGKDEQPMQVNGIDILISSVEKSVVGDAVVDYVSSLNREGFVITPASG
jgi:Fe-S cluster assembly iron-binding protein IscA